MSSVSTLQFSHKVYQCLAVLFCLLAMNASFGFAGTMPPLQRDYAFDSEISAADKQDRTRMSTYEFLETHGLRQIADQLGQFISTFDSSTHFFDQLNDTDEFEILNQLICIYRDAFVATVNEATRSAEAKSGSMSLSSMKDFVDRHEALFNERIRGDFRFKKWSKVLSQTHMVFDSMDQLYRLCVTNGITLPWWMMQMLGPLMSNIPDRLLDHEHFEDLLRVPSTLQTSLHELLEEVFTSGFGPMLKIAIQAVGKWAADRHDEI